MPKGQYVRPKTRGPYKKKPKVFMKIIRRPITLVFE